LARRPIPRDGRHSAIQIQLAMPTGRCRSALRTLLLASSALWAAIALGAEPAAVASAETRALDVPGFLPSVLFVPGGSDARPLVVAAHGAGGSPEWECDYWSRLMQGRSFVLCLRGTSMGKAGGFYYRDEHALEAELIAAERAARASQRRIASAGGVYAGFSQGSSFGSAIIARHGGAFPRLALIEGFERWNIPRARAFAKAGGQRVLFACGTKDCNAAATESARWLQKTGIEARVEFAAGAGHTPLDAVQERVHGALPWLLGAD
jgi:predicted esterase